MARKIVPTAARQYRPLPLIVCGGLNGARIAFVGGDVFEAVSDPDEAYGSTLWFPNAHLAFAAKRAAEEGLAEAYRIMGLTPPKASETPVNFNSGSAL